MPRKRRSPSPIGIADDLPPDDDDDAYTNEELSPNSNRCPPQQRNAANARERARMRVLSKAFCRLKTTLPWVPADTKLSKLDTLRLASGYIAHLRTLLDDQPSQESQLQGAPLNLSWPFTFQHGGGQAAWAPQQGSPNRGTPPRASLPPPQQNQPSPGPPDQQVFSCYQRQFTHGQNYYTQIQRDSGFMRHAYSDSLLHTG